MWSVDRRLGRGVQWARFLMLWRRHLERHVASTRMVSGAYAKAYGSGESIQSAIDKCKVPPSVVLAGRVLG